MCKMGLNMCKTGFNTSIWGLTPSQKMEVLRPMFGSQHPPQTGVDRLSQHAFFFREKKKQTKTTGLAYWRKERQPLNTMLGCFTHPSTVACAMWRCPQHNNTMTILTLNTRARRQRSWIILSPCSRVDGSSCCRVEDNTTSQMLAQTVFVMNM